MSFHFVYRKLYLIHYFILWHAALQQQGSTKFLFVPKHCLDFAITGKGIWVIARPKEEKALNVVFARVSAFVCLIITKTPLEALDDI